MTKSKDDLLTVDEVAAILRRSRPFVWDLIRTHKLPALQLNGRGAGSHHCYLITRTQLDRYLDAAETKPARMTTRVPVKRSIATPSAREALARARQDGTQNAGAS